MSSASSSQVFADVMTTESGPSDSAFEHATVDFVFGQVWARPGLTRRQRRLVTLACVCGAPAPGPTDEHMYAALASRDLHIDELLEFILHFAVYSGWPKASQAETSLRVQHARLQAERGDQFEPWPIFANESLGPTDHEVRLLGGEQSFADINLVPPPPRSSPYFHAGILGFVFGHVWQRPILSRTDRRYITIPCVGLSGAMIPIHSHVGSALGSGDVSRKEMDEIVLQFSAYCGFAMGEALHQVVAEEWARIEEERSEAP
jgi:4-carboxymuconolactone decarboxylase